MDKFITIQGQRIEVTDDVYAAYYKDSRREKYRDIDVKKGRFVVDAEAESVRYVESKEDSFERLFANGVEFSDDLSAEDRLLQREQMSQLKDALSILTDEEHLLIELIYVQQRTTRDIGVVFGISHTAVRKRHEAVLKKIRIFLQNRFPNTPPFWKESEGVT